jgi:ubiquinone/menaquinone biosynthesis C-methylase UbiE
MSHQKETSPQKKPWYVVPTGFVARIGYPLMPMAHKVIYEVVAPHLDLSPEDDLVEIACGNGHFLKKYASQVRSVAGLDLSPVGIELATKKHADRVAAGTAEVVCGDACELPWPWEDAKFTVATVMGSLPAFREPRKTFSEIFRILRPGGRAVISIEFNAEDGKDHTKDVEKWGYQILTEAQAREMAADAGFSKVEIAYEKASGLPKMRLVKVVK